MKKMRVFNFVMIILMMSSCAPIKRHQRLVKKYPFVHTNDTVVVRDTVKVFVPKIEFDTVFHKVHMKDTVTIIKDRMKVQFYTVHDSIYLNAECDTVTIEKIIEKKVPVKYYEAKNDTPYQKYLIWILIGLFILGLLFMLSKFKKNEN